MHTLEAELRELRAQPGADVAAVDRALALESGALFSVRRELLFALYAAALVVAGGVALLVRANLARIGPLALLAGILVASAVCYALALRPRLQGRERGLGLDYVLLLGALLASAAVGYAEVQFRWLGEGWSRHLLLLALWHLATAWLYDSRLVLSVALTSFAGWLGLEASLARLLDGPRGLRHLGWRALACAALYFAAALWHRHSRRRPAFREVYEQFAAHLAFWGVLALGFDERTRWLALALLVALAWFTGRAGFVQRRESLVLYAIGYSTFGALALEAQLLGRAFMYEFGLLTVAAAVLLLLRLRARLKEYAP